MAAASAHNVSGLLSIPPSLFWDGVDGSWSTFLVQIGSPAQPVRLLPGTSANAGTAIWAVIPPGCDTVNPTLPNCANERGYIFNSNKSSTWNTQRLANGGLFSLGDVEEIYLGLAGNAYYGFDTLELGLPGSGLPTIPNQLIAGYAVNDFWLGSLGLSPISTNFTNLDDPVPSLLSTLRTSSQIGSTSWAYTAGAIYQSPPVFGSLTLGGYDAARLNESVTLVNVPFGADFSRDLLIGVQSITYNTLGSSPLLSHGIYAFIDSMVSQMWLPVDVCQQFEQAFNLTWNATAELYLLTNDQHQNLLDQNPTLTFTLSASTDPSANDPVTQIQLPYSAFDLNITAPFVDAPTRYFPLKRAQNETQYTLGRVFLQEAYVIADYDRQQFQIGQALFPASSKTNLTAISPPRAGNNTSGNSNGPIGNLQNQKTMLSIGAIVGIVVAVVILLGSLLVGSLWYRRRRSNAIRRKQTETSDSDAHDSINAATSELANESSLKDGAVISHFHEADNVDANKHEMGDEGARKLEMDGDASHRQELVGHKSSHVHELPPNHLLAEMYAGENGRARHGFFSELEGSIPVRAELAAPFPPYGRRENPKGQV